MIEPKEKCCPLTLAEVLTAIKSDPDCINEIATAIFDDAENVEAISTAISENANSMEDIKQGLTECLNDPTLPGAADLISAMRDQVTPVVLQIPAGNSPTITGTDEQELVSFSYTPKFADSTIQVTAHYFNLTAESGGVDDMGFITRLRTDSLTGATLDVAAHGGTADPLFQRDNGTLAATIASSGSPVDFFITGALNSGATEGSIRDVDVVIIETPNP